MCVLTGMAGSSNVSSAATVAGEHIPCLGTMTPMLTGVRNTPYVTNKQGVNIYCDAPGLASSFTLYLSIMAHISKLTFSKVPMRPCSTALRSARWSSMWIICMQPWKERWSDPMLVCRKYPVDKSSTLFTDQNEAFLFTMSRWVIYTGPLFYSFKFDYPTFEIIYCVRDHSPEEWNLRSS